MIGSRALAGLRTPDDLSREDENGVTVAEAMREVGLDPERIGEAVREPGSVHAYVELHIEQGRVLEQRGLPVGVVTGIAGPVWLRFVLRGEACHAGATPMGSLRHDALAVAAAVVGAEEREAERSGTSVETVGRMEVEPGGVNVIPGRATFTVDLRDIDGDVRDRLEGRIADEAARVCEQRGVGLETETLQRLPPVPCSGEARDAIEAACEQLGFDPFGLPSGAGHDGMQLSGLCPIGMIFVRSRDGISHNPAEWSSKKDCAAGAEILDHTLLRLAG
jgi:allantoate deiminase